MINRIKYWIKDHFNKDFFNIIKTTFKGSPWDCDFLYDLEKVKIQEMCHYIEKTRRFVGWERVVRDMKLCMSLIDIFTQKKDLFGIEYEEGYENRPVHEQIKHMKIKSMMRVNTKNIHRFIKNEKVYGFYESYPYELYILKAKYLYHKIRNEKDFDWWD